MYNPDQFLNHSMYKPCDDNSIGALIRYLEQFPPDWVIKVCNPSIIVHTGYKAKPVIIDEYENGLHLTMI